MTSARRALCALSLACAALQISASSAATEPLALVELAPGVYVHQGPHEDATPGNLGGIANIGFIVGRTAVAVIDSGGSALQGERLRAAIGRVTDRPVRYVVLTHVHPDHVLGSTAFAADDPEFVGHHGLARALAERGAFYLDTLRNTLGALAGRTEIVLPTLEVRDELELDLGDRRLRVTAHSSAHTDNDLSVYDERTRTLWLSDLLFIERIPVIDGSLNGWLSVMADLRRIDAERVVPGHGPVTAPWPAALDAQERYLRALRDEIRGVIARNGTMEEAVETVGRSERGKWRLFDAYHARNVVTAFAELEWE